MVKSGQPDDRKKTMETSELFSLSSIHFVYRVQSAQKNKRETT